ncbi:PQQ-dependent sugar dehydrogenase [Hymenobacter arizonensis]|uniref:Dehydrogenase, PQQ-dependent, s-GDH family n=1 Tax=Hymenobacter arizonensis TaxID=1227077 RepID=A0A1I5WUW4_HYMAR|nr:PQQ-dependent sugar dehydrogenase [Hymenobacter arizonensis]SFQ23398.1 dehydrogenase, PQQ-dependent, s-GDH family [Hymenobacter arizonensis]
MKFLRNVTLALLAALPFAARSQAPALTTFSVGSTTVTASALATNLDHVWELLWGPDNFLWMTERSGRISRVDPATGQVLPLLTLPDVTPVGESGLLGMVLDPDFAATPYVYVVYNYTEAGSLKEKLVRLTYSATANTLTAPLVLLGDIPATTTHSGSRLLILPDRTLLMTTGDAQLLPEAQSLASLNGKILRLNLDGTVPADNPTPGSLVYTLGHRNPQGLVRLPDGRLYSSEHGPNNDDEINKIEAGRNYGWPSVEGNCTTPSELAFCAANNVREPLTTWTPTIAPAGLTYYDHPAIPGWRGSLLLATLKNQQLVQLPLSPTGDDITARTEFVTNAFGRLRAICVAPSGAVYLGTSNGSTDRIIALENRSFVATGTRAASDFSFSLFPNPARRQATVQLPQPNALLTVRDLLGRAVLTRRATGTTATLDLSSLRPGAYSLQVQTALGSATRQLVVE